MRNSRVRLMGIDDCPRRLFKSLAEIKEIMTDEIKDIVTWSDPERLHDLIASKLGKGNFVYAIIVCSHDEKSLIRLGASRDLTKRLQGYPIMDFIADVFVSYHVVSEDFRKAITPLLVSYFSDERNHDRRPSFLKGRKLGDCVQSELRSIEYKVERLFLDQYKKRHKRLPAGNPRTGSY